MYHPRRCSARQDGTIIYREEGEEKKARMKGVDKGKKLGQKSRGRDVHTVHPFINRVSRFLSQHSLLTHFSFSPFSLLLHPDHKLPLIPFFPITLLVQTCPCSLFRLSSLSQLLFFTLLNNHSLILTLQTKIQTQTKNVRLLDARNLPLPSAVDALSLCHTSNDHQPIPHLDILRIQN